MAVEKVIVFGATSAIAVETLRIWADRKTKMFLVARDASKLKTVADDLRSRGAEIFESTVDLADVSQHERLFDEAVSKMGDFDTVFVAYGSLGDQKKSEADFSALAHEMNVNFLSALSICHVAARRFEAQGVSSKKRTMCVISSVAGDRGRKSNYVYGSAKAGLTAALQGLRGRLHSSNVQVITIKPGFVDTPMTKDVKKGPLFATPQNVGKSIVRAVDRGTEVAYVPWFWRCIMTIVKSVPEKIFKRTNI